LDRQLALTASYLPVGAWAFAWAFAAFRDAFLSFLVDVLACLPALLRGFGALLGAATSAAADAPAACTAPLMVAAADARVFLCPNLVFTVFAITVGVPARALAALSVFTTTRFERGISSPWRIANASQHISFTAAEMKRSERLYS
jgi:hypothetical protein